MKKSYAYILSWTIIILFNYGCSSCHRSAPDISGINIKPVKIHRYEQALFNINRSDIKKGLDSIYPDYKVFLGNNYQDTLSIIRIENFLDDPKIIALKKETDKVFPSLDQVENNLTKAFRYVNYYVPDFNLPKVYSYISGLYYESPVEYHDSVLIIALDLFLGSKYEPYRAIGFSRDMTPDFLLPSCIKQIGISLLPEHLPQKTLLDQMMLHGKVLYFLDKVLPDLPDTLISGFTQAQEEWIHDNEGKVWALLIDDELLYSTDTFIINKFIQDGPFTSGLSEKSPAMLGRWIGWHIIRSYMNDHSGITMQELFKMADSQDLLSKSHYKPPRT